MCSNMQWEQSQRSCVLVTVLSPKGKMSLSKLCCSLGFYFFRRKSKIYIRIYYQTSLKAFLGSESYNLLLTLNEMISFWSHSSVVGAWGWCKLWNVNVYINYPLFNKWFSVANSHALCARSVKADSEGTVLSDPMSFLSVKTLGNSQYPLEDIGTSQSVSLKPHSYHLQ